MEPGEENKIDTDNSDLELGRIIPNGVGLTSGEVTAVDEIASRYGLSRNAILRYAVRSFILSFRAGSIDLSPLIETPPIPKKRLRMPK